MLESQRLFMISCIPIEYKSFFNKSIWPIDETLTGTTTPGQGGPGSNGNKEVLHTPQISKIEDSISNAV